MKPVSLAIGSALTGAAIAALLFHAMPQLSTADGTDTADKPAQGAASVPEEGVVALDKAALTHAGIRSVTLARAEVTTQRHGFARALDISALSAIESEIESARAALAASQADYVRQRSLAVADQSAATRAVETSRAQAAADEARLATAVRRVGLEFGPGLGGFSASELSQLVRAVAAGNASLIRVDFPDGPAVRGATAKVSDGHVSSMVTLLGAAAATDARLQTAGSLAIVRGPLALLLGAGRVLPAVMTASSGTQSGVLVPRDSILRYQGGLWVYHVVPGGFSRTELIGAEAQPNGWFTPSGVKPGDKVAAGGIGVLLSIERGGTPGEDE